MTPRVRLLEAMAASSDPVLREKGSRELAQREEARRRAKAIRRTKRGRAPGKTKAERDAERAAHWADTRAKVRARVLEERQGRCEWDCERMADDPHHLLNGGARTAYESPETVAGICREDHRGYEKGDPEVLRRAWFWALRGGRRLAFHEIEHRIWKATEARESRSARSGT